jgi:hypothetical protein
MMTLREYGSQARVVAGLLLAMAMALAALLASATMAQATPGFQQQTPHPVEGMENCVSCHPAGTGGVIPSPDEHANYGNDSCLGCHPVVQAEPAEPAPGAPPDAPQLPPEDACLTCHSNPDLTMTLPSGEEMEIFVEGQELAGSVHAQLTCTDCHRDISAFPHRPLQVETRREYTLTQSDLCHRCHFEQATRTLDSIHFGILGEQLPSAPVCTDCHGYHDVPDPATSPDLLSTRCGHCHAQVYDSYAGSVHGAALLAGGHPDVPACGDCHLVHTSITIDRATFRLEVPEMCGRCHADEEMMDRYGLKSNVYDTYARDFHGATVGLLRQEGVLEPVDVAVCSDCHGVHDIQPMAGTVEQVEQRALEMCQRCHPDAGENFPDAWLGHYEISLEDAPLAWLVRAFYTVLIPFMLIGLMLHIVVDLWQFARRR